MSKQANNLSTVQDDTALTDVFCLCILHSKLLVMIYFFLIFLIDLQLFSLLLLSLFWHCWLGCRKSIHPIKNWSDEALLWLSVWSEVQMICILFR